jgi:NitT/TauT family transport system permease protein
MRNAPLGPIFLFVAILSFWEAVRVVFKLPVIILPPLTDVIKALANEPRFLTHCLLSLSEAAAGFLIGNIIAIAVAILILKWKSLEGTLMFYAIAVKTTPIIAVAPILIIWFGGGWMSKAVAAATVCFFPTMISLVRGLRLVDGRDYQEYADLFRSWHVGWFNTLLHLRAPFALPLFFSALKVSSSLALVGAIVGEFIAADMGLGYLIVVHSRRLETAEMFAAIFASTIMGILWFYLIVVFERRLSKRFGTLTSERELL